MTAEVARRESPLAGIALPATDAVRVREIPFLAMISVRGAPEPALLAAAMRATGLALPSTACTAATADGRRALWLGPDEWLIVAPDAERASLVAALEQQLAGRHAAIVDVSAARTVIEIAGEGARATLAKGCLLDLHPRVFAPGRCVGTMIAKIQVVLEQTADAPVTYRLYVRPSFSRHLARWLAVAVAPPS